MQGEHNRSLWLALLLMLLVQLIVLFQMRGPRPKPPDAPLEEFSAGRAVTVLRRLLGDEAPHPTGSDANGRVRARLVAELEALGLEVEIQQVARGPDPRLALHNVLARIPNTTSMGCPLVLATHYDSVSAGPGAADAGSCVVALLETARVLQRGGPYKRPVYFLFTDGEEAGMLGASVFAGVHSLAKEKPFVMNFEARGTSGPSLMFETHRGNLAAVRMLARHLPRPRLIGSSFVTVYRVLPNDTDFTVFQRDGWTGLNFAFIGDAHHYHTAQDDLEHLSLRSLQHHGENALALARVIAEDDQVDLDASDQDALFFDVLGFHVFVFPESWAWRLALVPLLVLVLRYGAHFCSTSTWHGTVLVTATVLVVLFAAAASGAVLTRALIAADLVYRAHVPYIEWLGAIHAFISMALVWCGARLFLRHVPDQVAWFAFWTLWSIAGLALAVTVPGFSYFLVAPAMGAALLSWLPLGMRGRSVVSVVMAAIVLLPLANLLPIALGARAGVIFHPVWALVWLPLLPLFAVPDTGGKKTQGNPAATS